MPWRVWGVSERGPLEELPIVQREGEAVTGELITSALSEAERGAPEIRQLRGVIEASLEGGQGVSITGTDAWGERAALAAESVDGDSLTLFQNALVWAYEGQALASVRHRRTLAIVPLPSSVPFEDLLVQYLPPEGTFEFAGLPGPGLSRFEPLIELRGYFAGSVRIVDAMRGALGPQFVRLGALAGRGPAVLVARAADRAVATSARRDTDPVFASRLDRAERRNPELAQRFPNLRDAGTPDAEVACAVVLVHGTASTALPLASDLAALFDARGVDCVYRFEHDTFHSIWANAEQLAERVRAIVRANRIVFACHSRGGLVARAALAKLGRSRTAQRSHVVTLGTPHNGARFVDIVEGAGALVRAFYLIGAKADGLVPDLDPGSAAYSYLVGAAQVPAGISDMRPTGSFVGMLSATESRAATARTESYGAEFIGDDAYSFQGAFRGAFSSELAKQLEQPNDLVVGQDSACGFGTAHRLRGPIDHSTYLTAREVQAGIAALLT